MFNYIRNIFYKPKKNIIQTKYDQLILKYNNYNNKKIINDFNNFYNNNNILINTFILMSFIYIKCNTKKQQPIKKNNSFIYDMIKIILLS